jgi:hypothetical protein
LNRTIFAQQVPVSRVEALADGRVRIWWEPPVWRHRGVYRIYASARLLGLVTGETWLAVAGYTPDDLALRAEVFAETHDTVS